MQAIARTSSSSLLSLFRNAARRSAYASSSSRPRLLSSYQRATGRSSLSFFFRPAGNSRVRFFSYSAPATQRYVYKRFGQPQTPWPQWQWQGQGQGPGRPPWYVQHRYLLMAVGAFGGFYLYNLETVEVRMEYDSHSWPFFFFVIVIYFY